MFSHHIKRHSLITDRRIPTTAHSESAQLQNVKVDGESQHQGKAKKRKKNQKQQQIICQCGKQILSMHSHCTSHCRRLSKNILSKLFG